MSKRTKAGVTQKVLSGMNLSDEDREALLQEIAKVLYRHTFQGKTWNLYRPGWSDQRLAAHFAALTGIKLSRKSVCIARVKAYGHQGPNRVWKPHSRGPRNWVTQKVEDPKGVETPSVTAAYVDVSLVAALDELSAGQRALASSINQLSADVDAMVESNARRRGFLGYLKGLSGKAAPAPVEDKAALSQQLAMKFKVRS